MRSKSQESLTSSRPSSKVGFVRSAAFVAMLAACSSTGNTSSDTPPTYQSGAAIESPTTFSPPTTELQTAPIPTKLDQFAPGARIQCIAINLVSLNTNNHEAEFSTSYTIKDPSVEYMSTTWIFEPATPAKPNETVSEQVRPDGLIKHTFLDNVHHISVRAVINYADPATDRIFGGDNCPVVSLNIGR